MFFFSTSQLFFFSYESFNFCLALGTGRTGSGSDRPFSLRPPGKASLRTTYIRIYTHSWRGPPGKIWEKPLPCCHVQDATFFVLGKPRTTSPYDPIGAHRGG